MTNLLKRYLDSERIILLDEVERFAAIATMNRLLEEQSGCPVEVSRQIVEREYLLSTAVGNHIAVPHAKSETIESINIALGVSGAGIDWEAIDDRPVHLVFVVTASLKLNRDYLHLLADIVRNFNNIALVQELAAITDLAELRDRVLQIISD